MVDTNSFALILSVRSLLIFTIRTVLLGFLFSEKLATSLGIVSVYVAGMMEDCKSVLFFPVAVKAIIVFGFCCCRTNSLIMFTGMSVKA